MVMRVGYDVFLLITEAVVDASPSRFLRVAKTCKWLYDGGGLPGKLWKRCYHCWFGVKAALTMAEYRARCIAFVRLYSRDEFVIARLVAANFHFHPTVNFPEPSLLDWIKMSRPATTDHQMQIALRILAPYFDFDARRGGDSWQVTVGKFTKGENARYRQLALNGSLPSPRIAVIAPLVISIFVAPIPANQPSKKAQGVPFFSTRVLRYKDGIERVIAASLDAPRGSITTTPVCLPGKADRQRAGKVDTWMGHGLHNTAGAGDFPHGLAPANAELGGQTHAGKLYGAAHLKRLFAGHASDVFLVLFHGQADPLPSLEEWARLTRKLTPTSAIGFCFPADLSYEYDWATDTIGSNHLDHILSVKCGTLRIARAALQKAQTLKQLWLKGELGDWLKSLEIEGAEIEKLVGLIERGHDMREQKQAYNGDNGRVVGDAVPRQYLG
ncbi:hypothetical protein DFH09DRAFT_1371872 [Mycena vulgaris]|nr:hypothetical protein DFH09DRAFT_1371872 [Mycena vulgaris]